MHAEQSRESAIAATTFCAFITACTGKVVMNTGAFLLRMAKCHHFVPLMYVLRTEVNLSKLIKYHLNISTKTMGAKLCFVDDPCTG